MRVSISWILVMVIFVCRFYGVQGWKRIRRGKGKIFVSSSGLIRIESWVLGRKGNFYVQHLRLASCGGKANTQLALLKLKPSSATVLEDARLGLKSHMKRIHNQISVRIIMDGQSLSSDRLDEISDSHSSFEFSFTHSCLKFKGVVSQQNGHWGAQIYTNHQRVWLGTFKSAKEAAMAYDSAAIKLRNGESHRNFPWTNITVHEPNFQSQFSTETVLAMIKDGSYAARFSDFVTGLEQGHCLSANPIPSSSPGIKLKQLFQKELTPSDVGKLNRLVIPKRHAMKYFPRIGGVNRNSVVLVIFDRLMRSWEFRYCYWRSSQSFVLTKGWKRFTRQKGLRAGDRVVFSLHECSDQKVCLMDVAYNDGNADGASVEKQSLEEEEDSGNEVNVKRNEGFKLFGVQIG